MPRGNTEAGRVGGGKKRGGGPQTLEIGGPRAEYERGQGAVVWGEDGSIKAERDSGSGQCQRRAQCGSEVIMRSNDTGKGIGNGKHITEVKTDETRVLQTG